MSYFLKFLITVVIIALASCGNSPQDNTPDTKSTTNISKDTTITEHKNTSAESVSTNTDSEPTAESISYNDYTPMPFPYGNASMDFFFPLDVGFPKLDLMPDIIISHLDDFGMTKVDYRDWCNTLVNSYDAHTLNEFQNVYSFMVKFKIPISTLKEFLVGEESSYYFVGDKFTEEEIDIIASRNEELILDTFKDKAVLINGTRFYTPSWIYYHNIEDYKKEKLTHYNLADWINEQIKYLSITDRAKDAFEQKIYEYFIECGDDSNSELICGYDKDFSMPIPYNFDPPNKFESKEEYDKFDFYTYYSFRHPFYDMDDSENIGYVDNKPWEYMEWIYSVGGIPRPNMTKLSDFGNLFSYANKFNISNEQLEQILNENYAELDKHKIDIFLSRDEIEILKTFASDYTIVKDNHFYSPAWVHYNKPQAYHEAEITPEELREMLPKYKELGILSEEAMIALEDKIKNYT